jgi:uncharacterized protein YciI
LPVDSGRYPSIFDGMRDKAGITSVRSAVSTLAAVFGPRSARIVPTSIEHPDGRLELWSTSSTVAKPQAGELWAELTEAHWSFMDAYADAMIARGPTLNEDGTAATGSMHIVDLPNEEAARAFAFDEPNYWAGVYEDAMIRRWRNELGRTMWEFEGDPTANQRLLVIGHGTADGDAQAAALRDEQAAYFVDKGYLDRLIELGPLLSKTARDGSAARCWSRCPTVPASRRCSPAIRS